jgi:putative acetyltransferase
VKKTTTLLYIVVHFILSFLFHFCQWYIKRRIFLKSKEFIWMQFFSIWGIYMKIIIDDLTGGAVQELVREHLQGMHENSPPESIHALGLEQLRQPEITFYSGWEDNELVGCGALKELDDQHGEVKSMRTSKSHLRNGVAKCMLEHIIEEAKQRGYRRLSLETGSQAAFEPARKLYASFMFNYCEPFGDYTEDPNSVFMTKEF